METKRGRGRPPKPPDEQRSELFTIRVTPDERSQIEKAGGEKPSIWARDVLLKAARRKR
jgi:hypothetical protein